MTFIAGPFSASFKGPADTTYKSLGTIGSEGFELDIQLFGEEIQGDNLGQSIQDYVQQGANCFLNFVLQEFDAANAQACFWPFYLALSPVSASNWGEVGEVGHLGTQVAGDLMLQKTYLSTGIAAEGFFNFVKCAPAPDFNFRTFIGSRHRNVPMRMIALPFKDASDSNKWKWFKKAAVT